MPPEILGRLPMRPVNRKRERVFFCCMTLLMIATILLGFRKTYFPLGAKPPALSSWVIQIHGILFSAVSIALAGADCADCRPAGAVAHEPGAGGLRAGRVNDSDGRDGGSGRTAARPRGRPTLS